MPNRDTDISDGRDPYPAGRLRGGPAALLRAASGLGAWARANRLKAAVAIAGCVLTVGAGVAGWALIGRQDRARDRLALAAAFRALDRGDYDEARNLAEALQTRGGLRSHEWAAVAFVLGAAAGREADVTWSRDQRRYYLLAARYLEEARDRGFPPGRRAEGLYLLGRSLCLSGQLAASRPILLAALDAGGDRATAIHRLLARAYLHDANPRYGKALEHNTAFLADRRLAPDERHEGLLDRARILLRMERIADCLAALDEIPTDAANRAEKTVLRGRVLMLQAETLQARGELSTEEQLRVRQRYEAAIKTLRAAQGHDTLSSEATPQALYLIGVCYRELGDDRAAVGQFQRTASLYAQTPEALAAGLDQADLARQLGQNGDAASAYLRVLAAVADPDTYSNPWVPLDELRRRMLEAYQHYRDTGKFVICLELARRFHPLFSRTRALEIQAEAHLARGRELLDQAAPGATDAEKLRRKGRGELRRAGLAQLRLAEIRVATREYTGHLWNAAEAFLAGQDYDGAVSVLKNYLRNETRNHQAEALLHLGQSLLALDRLDEAAAALAECIELHPRDPAVFAARLVAAQTAVEQGDLERAEALLQENLVGERLTPDSREWRRSLFALGKIYHERARYQDAVRRLEEAVARYPQDPQAVEARYLIAEAYRRSADALPAARRDERGRAGGAPDAGRPAELYRESLVQYNHLREHLARLQETRELTPNESAMLRNGHFAVGSVLARLGELQAAVGEYSHATRRYQGSPEVLDAYVGMADAYRRLGEPLQARRALEQAKAVLSRLKPDAAYAAVTNYTREQWGERLEYLSGL